MFQHFLSFSTICCIMFATCFQAGSFSHVMRTWLKIATGFAIAQPRATAPGHGRCVGDLGPGNISMGENHEG